jgi:hypothetical protein
MKTSLKTLALLVSVVLIACAGGNAAKKQPEYIPAGMQAITKGTADDLAAIGTAYLHLDNKGAGVNYLKRSIKIYALIGSVKKVEEILQDLDNISKTSGYDISVTLHFVNQWLEGNTLESLCK